MNTTSTNLTSSKSNAERNFSVLFTARYHQYSGPFSTIIRTKAHKKRRRLLRPLLCSVTLHEFRNLSETISESLPPKYQRFHGESVIFQTNS